MWIVRCVDLQESRHVSPREGHAFIQIYTYTHLRWDLRCGDAYPVESETPSSYTIYFYIYSRQASHTCIHKSTYTYVGDGIALIRTHKTVAHTTQHKTLMPCCFAGYYDAVTPSHFLWFDAWHKECNVRSSLRCGGRLFFLNDMLCWVN